MKPNIDTSAKGLEPGDLNLTCTCLRFVNWDSSDADFEFLAGADKICRVHTVLAEFLSPKVASIRRCEPLCYSYKLNNFELFDVLESLVSSLRAGQALHVDNSNFVAFLRLSQELENGELLSSLLGMIKAESFSIDDAILVFHTGIDLGTTCSDEFGTLGDFIASHFYEIQGDILGELDLETAQHLLSNPSLKIEDEDSLYDFVRSRSENDLRFTSLFEFVHFEYLTVDRIENFVSFVSENLLGYISSGVWARISSRLIIDTKYQKKCSSVNAHHYISPTGYPRMEFVYDGSKPLDGIIAHLTRECGGNVHRKGIVEVTGRSVYRLAEPPEHAVDLSTDSEFHSRQLGAQWICYDFKERRVIPTSYTVKSIESNYMDADEAEVFGVGWSHLKSWQVEVSNDKRNWKVIDDRRDNSDLNRSRAIANFKVSHVPEEGFRFIRLIVTGPNHCGDYQLSLTALEIFGALA